MKILITGATGFLGKALCQQLETQGNDLIPINSKNCDLRKREALDQFNQQSFDQIYHLAAWTQAGDFCLYHSGEQWIINQQINTNVLAWWQKRQPGAKLICIGSSCAYDPNLELKEENYLTGVPIDSLFTYAMTKRMLYAGLLALQKQFGLKFLYLVPSTLYGPGYPLDGRQMHFIFDIIRKVVRAKKCGEPVVLWGNGDQRRELIYIGDFVRVMLQLEDQCENDIINIGAGEEFTIRHFAKQVCEKVGYDFNSIQFDHSRYTGAKSKCLVIRKLKSLIGDLHFIPLEEGLRRTIDWFLEEEEKHDYNSNAAKN